MFQVLQLGEFPCSREKYNQFIQAVDHVKVYQTVEQLLSREPNLTWVDAMICRITDPVEAELIQRMPYLKIIANYGAGTNNIDLDAALAQGITVTNTPNILGETVADFTWGLMIATCRHLVASDRLVREGHFHGWSPSMQLGTDLYGKTLGIVGLGDIGERVARRARGFNMPVIYHNRKRVHPDIEAQTQATYVSFEDLLRKSDIVSIHCPLTPKTKHLFNAEAFQAMKQGAFLINTSRGPVVDEPALVEALKSGHLKGAGLDVYENEPAVHPELMAMKNVVLTAHIGSATEETRRRMGDCVLDNVLAIHDGKPALTALS